MMEIAMSEPGPSTSAQAPAEAAPGSLIAHIDDQSIGLTMVGGGNWTLPIGVLPLLDGPLERADRPRPEQLTNALGAVADHLDDVLIESPIVGATTQLTVTGPHACMIARVELGLDDVPADYVLERTDADDVFRTLVAEPRAERVHNPGLDADHVDSIVATCCIVLALMRRLDLQCVGIRATDGLD